MQTVSESEEADEEEEEEEEEPPAKRTRRRSKASTSPPAKKRTKKGAATATKSPGRKRKAADSKPPKAKKSKEVKEKKEKPRPAGVLIPNENIELLEKDPTFETRYAKLKFMEDGIRELSATVTFAPGFNVKIMNLGNLVCHKIACVIH